jgi:hypothetical protein
MAIKKHRNLSAVLCAAMFVTFGCTSAVPDGERATVSPTPSVAAAVDCGKDDGHPSGQGYNAAGRACFWQNYQAGHPAMLLTSVYGVEGSKTEYELTVASAGGIDVVRQLDGKEWRFHCQKVERQDNTWGYRLGLLFTQCTTFDFIAVP